MSFLKKILIRGQQDAKSLGYAWRVALTPVQERVAYDVPYICQFAIPASAEPTLKKELQAIDDPAWEASGATSPERYAFWGQNMCGIVSAAMAMAFFQGTSLKPVVLAEDAYQAKVYKDHPSGVTDMGYREFATWVQKFGLRANVYSRLTVKGIQYALSSGKLIMVSVNPNIRGYATAPETKIGGHMVLVTGYDKQQGTITINNPSGFLSLKTQKDHVLSEKEFVRYFAGRGITLFPLKNR